MEEAKGQSKQPISVPTVVEEVDHANERGVAASHGEELPVNDSAIRLDGCSVDDFDLGSTCGTGSFSRVRLARYTVTNEFVALKIVKKDAVMRLKQIQHVKSEKEILRGVSHPFVVNLHGTFKDPHRLYFILEYIPGGEFFSYIRRMSRLPESSAVFYTSQIVLILEYLHSYRIAYRDLKPENLLLSSDGYLKLTDFGFAKVVRDYTYTLCGTPEYIAPEILLNQGHSTAVDWWSLGILVYEMLCGYPPFIAETTLGIYQKIVAGKLYLPRILSKDARSLIKNLLTSDLTKRWGNLSAGVDDIRKCDWLRKVEWDRIMAKEVGPPFIPPVSSNTSNFEVYPESDPVDVTGVTCYPDDPFADW